MTEAGFRQKFLAALRTRRIWCMRVETSTAHGIPDVLAVHGGPIFIELKVAKGTRVKLEASQALWHKRFIENGGTRLFTAIARPFKGNTLGCDYELWTARADGGVYSTRHETLDALIGAIIERS